MAADRRRAARRAHLAEGRERAQGRRRQAYALEAVLKPLKSVDWRTLAGRRRSASQAHDRLAFRELAGNAGNIGQLNITPTSSARSLPRAQALRRTPAMAAPNLDKIVLVTRRTRLKTRARFNMRAGEFYIEHAGDFAGYVTEHDAYQRSLETLRRGLELGLKVQEIERHLVPTYLFSNKDVVVTVGQDGLVENTAKYCGEQPIVAVNPDPERFDGILLPFTPAQAAGAVMRVLAGRAKARAVTQAEVRLNDGQRLLGFNISTWARGRMSRRGTDRGRQGRQAQSSSGAGLHWRGSTGWLVGLRHGAGVAAFAGGSCDGMPAIGWRIPPVAQTSDGRWRRTFWRSTRGGRHIEARSSGRAWWRRAWRRRAPSRIAAVAAPARKWRRTSEAGSLRVGEPRRRPD
jgi:hypothetical protein